VPAAIPAGRISKALTIGGRFCRGGLGEAATGLKVRIDGNSRTQVLGYRSGTTRGAGAGATSLPEEPASTNAAAGTAPMAASTGIEALLALQAIEDPVFAKRKAVRRGSALLDALDDIKTDLLIGQVSEGRLNKLLALIGQAREATIPGLDSVIDDIELRARVELAKFGHFAST